MSPGEARDLDEQIKLKQFEAHAAWKEYVEAVNNTDASRYGLEQMREILAKEFAKEFNEGLPLDTAALAMIDGLVQIQSGLEERVQQLGLKCDAIGHEVIALQLKKGRL